MNGLPLSLQALSPVIASGLASSTIIGLQSAQAAEAPIPLKTTPVTFRPTFKMASVDTIGQETYRFGVRREYLLRSDPYRARLFGTKPLSKPGTAEVGVIRT